MQIASFEASWPVLSAIKWSRQYHAMLATPLRVGDVLLGHQAFIAFRMLMTATVYLAVIAAFGAVNSPLGILAIPVAVLVGIAFAAPIAAWGAYTENEASFVAIFRFVILPMFLFSGTFFPIEQLPEALQASPTSRRSGTASTSAGSSRSVTSTFRARSGTSPTCWPSSSSA